MQLHCDIGIKYLALSLRYYSHQEQNLLAKKAHKEVNLYSFSDMPHKLQNLFVQDNLFSVSRHANINFSKHNVTIVSEQV